MKRLPLLAAALFAIGWMNLTPATADTPAGSGVAVGAGADSPYGVPFAFDAVGGPDGATGTMTLWQNFTDPPVVAAVRCVGIRGNSAVISGIITSSTASPGDGGAVGNEMIFFVEDNATPGDGVDRIDAFWGTPSAGTCQRSESEVGPTPAILTGDIVVREGPVLPVTADECKNDGWRSYGVFKNQGDCVSYVVTSGHNPPADG